MGFLRFIDKNRSILELQMNENNILENSKDKEKKYDFNQNNSEFKIPMINNQNALLDKSNSMTVQNAESKSLLAKNNIEKPRSLFETSIINNTSSLSGNLSNDNSILPPNKNESAVKLATQNKIEVKIPLEIKENIPNKMINLNQNMQMNKIPINPIQQQEQKQIIIELPKEEIKENKPKLSAMQKLSLASDNYFTLRIKISQISEDKNKKAISDKIATEINVIINQLSQMEDITNNATRISVLLSELKKSNQLELYLFTIDLLIKRLIFKSEKYKSEHKRNYLIFGKFIFELNKLVGSNLISDFFMQLIVYKCPYIAFKEINKSDYPDDKTYKKRLGFSNENESMTEFFSNIESYTYLFFAFIFHTLRFYSSNPNHANYKHYLSNLLLYLEDFLHFFESCESKEIKYPHIVIYKVFLNCLGNEMNKHIQNVNEKLIKIALKIVKHMEEQKKKTGVTSEIKSLITDNLHFIKTYAKEIKDRKITDMHRQ